LRFLGRFCLSCFFVAALSLPGTARAVASSDSELPDAPQPTAAVTAAQDTSEQSSSSQKIPFPLPPKPPARLAKYISTGQTTDRLSAKEKLELSGWEQLQPYAFATQLLGAGWEQLLDSNPQYGTDAGAFGQRLGAAALLQNSRAVLSDGVLAGLFHQDPRYYRQGHRTVKERAFYAAERVFVIRSDDGNSQPNYSQLLGNAAATALTMTYYPAVSATWPKTAKGYGISLAQGALGNEIHEFTPFVERMVFHRHH
jgi:hypothetical protein